MLGSDIHAVNGGQSRVGGGTKAPAFPAYQPKQRGPARLSVSSRPNHHGDQPVTGRFRAGGIAAEGVPSRLDRRCDRPMASENV